MKISISRAWEETKVVLANEGRLLAAVALAMFVLPGIIINTITPARSAANPLPHQPWLIVLIFLFALVSLAGQLAVIRLAMSPHVSVGEAITHGFRRLPAYLGALLLWTVPMTVIVFLAFAAMSGSSAGAKAVGAIILLIFVVIMLIISIRMVLSSAVASAESAGPVQIIRRSWELTRGNWWRLFGFLLLFVIGAAVLFLAVSAVTGMLAAMLFGRVAPMTIGGLLVAAASQVVNGLFSVVLMVIVARIYGQIAGHEAVEVSVPSSGI